MRIIKNATEEQVIEEVQKIKVLDTIRFIVSDFQYVYMHRDDNGRYIVWYVQNEVNASITKTHSDDVAIYAILRYIAEMKRSSEYSFIFKDEKKVFLVTDNSGDNYLFIVEAENEEKAVEKVADELRDNPTDETLGLAKELIYEDISDISYL